MHVDVPLPRSSVAQTADGLEISIPARRNAFTLIFLVILFWQANLRVSPMSPSERRRSWNPGIIAFDYGATTVRFGGGVDEAEAASIVANLKSRYNLA
jgi:hypothetical protein